MKVDFNALETGSAIALAGSGGASTYDVDLSGGGRPVQVCVVRDVLYLPSILERGQSLQIVQGRLVPIEAILREFTLGFVRDRLSDTVRATYAAFEPDTVADTVCILGNVFSRNFTHWHEELMKVVVIESAGIPCRYVLADLPAFAAELLDLIGVAPERLLEVTRPTVFTSAVYSSPVSYQGIVDYPAVFLALREALQRVDVSDQPTLGPRLWLERGAQARLGRSLVNAQEVGPYLEKYGFVKVDMGAVPVRAQMAAARSATIMAGLHGSHFVHSQLMARRSHVIECFSPLYLNPTYTEIYRVLRHRYAQISSSHTPAFPYEYGIDVNVDCSHLELALHEAAG